MDPLCSHDPMPLTVGTTAQSALTDLLSLGIHLSGENGAPVSPALRNYICRWWWGRVASSLGQWCQSFQLWKSM